MGCCQTNFAKPGNYTISGTVEGLAQKGYS